MEPMNPVIVIAHTQAAVGHIDTIREALLALVAPTRREAGCLRYDLHQDRADPSHFFFHEIWASDEALNTHLASPHIQAYRQTTEGKVAHRDIRRLQALEPA